jgi:hypothetical protein
MAEQQGVQNVGLSWIWKEKYDDNPEGKGKKKKKTKQKKVGRDSSA